MRLPAFYPSLTLRPDRRDELELLDLPGHEPHLLAENLADVRRVNRWLGGCRLTIQALDSLTDSFPSGRKLDVLDVGTGAADVPEAIVGWAERRGLSATVVATDSSAEVLAVAAPRSPAVELAVADARSLPFADRSFDVAACSLLVHHLSPDEAVVALREMRRVARLGVVVNDLVRGWPGYAGAWLLAHIFSRNPLTRHDAPLSALRAYTRSELAVLAGHAGLGPLTFFGFLGYRVAIAARTPT